jgi:hypothetical protein
MNRDLRFIADRRLFQGPEWIPGGASHQDRDWGITRRKESRLRKRTFPLSQVYRLLEPGPVVLVTTASKGRASIMNLSWHTMMEFEPPLAGCGNTSARSADKFGLFRLTPEPAFWSRRRSSRSAMRTSNARSRIPAW